jgi:cobalt-zinc-cadmium efflux system membrane fusion protein
MGVKVSFLEDSHDAREAAGALVPKGAIFADGDQSYVFVVRNGRAERRAVRTGRERGVEIEVIAGLRPGEQVVTESVESIREGDRVSARK